MPSQRISNMQRSFIVFFFVSLFSTSVLSAHGNEKHVIGTITAIAAGSISVETPAHEVQTVQITGETRFFHSGNPSSLNELKVGDRVVIHAKPAGDKLNATEVKSGAQPQSGVSKK